MIKLQEFAQSCCISDRQVQRLIKKYESEISGRFERRGHNGTWLDETACNFLRSKMKKQPISVITEQDLNKELVELYRKHDNLKDNFLLLKEKCIALENENKNIKLLEEKNKKTEELLNETQKIVKETEEELNEFKSMNVFQFLKFKKQSKKQEKSDKTDKE